MQSHTLRLISQGILREILRKKQLLERSPEYHLHYANGKKKSLRNESNKHSVSLELEIYDTKSAEGRRTKAREYHRCLDNFSGAIEWGLRNYSGELSGAFIKEIGSRVEPETNAHGYRSEKVRITGSVWSPPSPEKIEREISTFLFENVCLDNVIAQSAHAHFHVARIHPFSDGNGRTARAIQNIMLEKTGFFPADVKPSERLEYVHLLDSAVNSYKIADGNLSSDHLQKLNQLHEVTGKPEMSKKEKEYHKSLAFELGKARMTKEQAEFYNFIALKVRDRLREESDKLYKLRRNK